MGRKRRIDTRRRGTAMAEMVLAVPLLGLILGLTFFFGWALMHKHEVLVANRHAAWRRIETGAWPSEEELNVAAFGDEAEDVRLSGSESGLRRTAADLAGEADSRHQMAGDYADELIVNRFPAGRRANVSANFGSDEALWNKFVGYIPGEHGREGVTWRRDEVNPWSTLRDGFYADFAREMLSVPAPASAMARTIRHLYLANWPAAPGTPD